MLVLVLVGGRGVPKNAKAGEGNHARKLLLAPLATGEGRVSGGCGRRRRRSGDGDGEIDAVGRRGRGGRGGGRGRRGSGIGLLHGTAVLRRVKIFVKFQVRSRSNKQEKVLPKRNKQNMRGSLCLWARNWGQLLSSGTEFIRKVLCSYVDLMVNFRSDSSSRW